jgi:hypothetical protein
VPFDDLGERALLRLQMENRESHAMNHAPHW